MNIIEAVYNTINELFRKNWHTTYTYTYANKKVLYNIGNQCIMEDGTILTLYYTDLLERYVHPDYEYKYPEEVINEKNAKVIFVYKDYVYYLDNYNKINKIFSTNL